MPKRRSSNNDNESRSKNQRRKKTDKDSRLAPAEHAAALEDEEYEIESILDVRLKHGRQEFLIQWKDYPPSCNSWEPRAHLNKAALRKFDAKQNDEAEFKQSQQQEEELECCICFEVLKEHDKAKIDPCSHQDFCFNCIVTWSKTNKTCPLCMTVVTQVFRCNPIVAKTKRERKKVLNSIKIK
ncbi:hypothetical protein MPSEU_000940900 [Mayamaea pseudoterrestris]|nr:hypothetical protein MPSEU_000940900 [Mayamaea pseudoterrestris]